MRCITDMETWLLDNDDRIYRWWKYKKVFTPYEISEKFIDESIYEDEHCNFGYIVEAIDLGSGDWLLGFLTCDESEDEYGVLRVMPIEPERIEYAKLSEISLSYYEYDSSRFREKLFSNEDD